MSGYLMDNGISEAFERCLMKSADAMMAENLFSVADYRLLKTRLRRVAGSLENEAATRSHGLSGDECKTLTEAAALLRTLSSRYEECRKKREKMDVQRDRVEAQIKQAMVGNFGALSSVEDKISLIGATASYVLKKNQIIDLRDLEYQFSDAKSSIIFRAREKVIPRSVVDQAPAAKVTAQAAVDELWAIFCGGRAKIADEWRSLIARLQELEGQK